VYDIFFILSAFESTEQQRCAFLFVLYCVYCTTSTTSTNGHYYQFIIYTIPMELLCCTYFIMNTIWAAWHWLQ